MDAKVARCCHGITAPELAVAHVARLKLLLLLGRSHQKHSLAAAHAACFKRLLRSRSQ